LCFVTEGEDMRRRMYSRILLVGGGFVFEGVTEWLGELILKHIPPHIVTSLESTDIVYQPKVSRG